MMDDGERVGISSLIVARSGSNSSFSQPINSLSLLRLMKGAFL